MLFKKLIVKEFMVEEIHCDKCKAKVEQSLKAIDGVEVYATESSCGIVSFNIKGIHPHDASTIFDEKGIALRAGHHCAQLITKWLGVTGTLRASIYLYNDYSDIDKLIEATTVACEYFKEWII